MSGRPRARDHYSKRAKAENYPARSVYKLEEIDLRTRLLRSGDRVIDLGAAPGSWTLYAANKVGDRGQVVAVDRSALGVGVPSNVVFVEADVFELDAEALRELGGEKGFDAVISDMAPRTSGHRFVDQSRSFELFSRALEIAALTLRPGGRFTGKIFFGEDFEVARNMMRGLFSKERVMKPSSVRSESFEVYLVGLNRR